MNSTKNPYWYKLIKRLKSEKIITTGLTIPYIYGAYKTIGKPFTSIQQLIEHILNSSIDKYPVIQKCHVIQQDVVMVERKEICNKTYSKDVRIDNDEKNNILFISSNTNLGNTKEKIYRSLAVLYDNPINRNEFSWNNAEQKWEVFRNWEIETIKDTASS